MGRYDGWSEEEIAEYRRKDKHREYLRSQGISQSTDAAPVITHVHALREEMGWSTRQIAQAADLHITGVGRLAAGHKAGEPIRTVRRSTAEAILAIPLTSPPAPARRQRTNPIGTRRRLQALHAAGYPMPLLAELLGWKSYGKNRVHMLMCEERAYVYQHTYDTIAALYDKYIGVDPATMVEAVYVKRAKLIAAKHHFAPAHCWDSWTIDDPDAIPEWTGMCGTAEGYRIHRREDIPQCRPCVLARVEYNRKYSGKPKTKSLPTTNAECGTEAKARHHRRIGEEVCPRCHEAETVARRERKQRKREKDQ